MPGSVSMTTRFGGGVFGNFCEAPDSLRQYIISEILLRKVVVDAMNRGPTDGIEHSRVSTLRLDSLPPR